MDYRPKEKIEETIAFVSQFDYPKIAKDTIDSMLGYLEKNSYQNFYFLRFAQISGPNLNEMGVLNNCEFFENPDFTSVICD